MNKRLEIYKCSTCGTIVTVNRGGAGGLICCGKAMEHMNKNSTEAATEKHIPVLISVDKNRYRVVVGEIEHPMTEEHYIEWIDVLLKNGSRLTFFLNPHDRPEAIFETEEKIIEIQTYCNLHGLWNKKE